MPLAWRALTRPRQSRALADSMRLSPEGHQGLRARQDADEGYRPEF